MAKTYIWDLDGTLLDSYDVIVESLYLTFREHGVELSREQIHQYAISFSSSDLIQKVAGERGLNPMDLFAGYARHSRDKYQLIKKMPNALQILETLSASGAQHHVFTHRGRTTTAVLEMLGLDGFFGSVITSQSGFARKPAPDAIFYLLEKYGLSKEDTFYVGDRKLDMESARNAGIRGILYLPEGSRGVPTGAESYVVTDLMQILTIE